jgi:hypothetical protein
LKLDVKFNGGDVYGNPTAGAQVFAICSACVKPAVRHGHFGGREMRRAPEQPLGFLRRRGLVVMSWRPNEVLAQLRPRKLANEITVRLPAARHGLARLC